MEDALEMLGKDRTCDVETAGPGLGFHVCVPEMPTRWRQVGLLAGSIRLRLPP